ncbi:hypothetical protein EJ02DRAFT_468991 [Clathrospora elynae]|uniref:Uncharacterized protein n=1 Tax=Clathrospora elynae TaxID=706981 RepID=A0A6A5SEU6_9PLEO|nr:hypothetical protein EJ02DRAFT_468991 [Clathrospora elynae]
MSRHWPEHQLQPILFDTSWDAGGSERGPTPASTAPPSSGSAPAGTTWDRQYYVSTESPAYVWKGGAWTSKPSTDDDNDDEEGDEAKQELWERSESAQTSLVTFRRPHDSQIPTNVY